MPRARTRHRTNGPGGAKSLRTAAGFLAALPDGREVWLEGARVADVTADPRLRGAALTVAELYEMQHDPALRDRLSFVLDERGERVGYSHIQPRSIADLRRRRETAKLWADWNGGMLGRTADFMNMMFAGCAAAAPRGPLPHPHARPSPARPLDGLPGGHRGGERLAGRGLRFICRKSTPPGVWAVDSPLSARMDETPVPGPGGTVVPNPRYLGQERFYFLDAFPRLLEIVRTLGAGGLMMTPGDADVRGARAGDIDRYYQAAALPAARRIARHTRQRRRLLGLRRTQRAPRALLRGRSLAVGGARDGALPAPGRAEGAHLAVPATGSRVGRPMGWTCQPHAGLSGGSQREGRLAAFGGEAQVKAKPKLSHPLISE
jgi:hypothetical protein